MQQPNVRVCKTIPLSEFQHQPGELQCCRECLNIKRDCKPNPMNCQDFYIANYEFIESKRLEADLADQVQEIESEGGASQ